MNIISPTIVLDALLQLLSTASIAALIRKIFIELTEISLCRSTPRKSISSQGRFRVLGQWAGTQYGEVVMNFNVSVISNPAKVFSINIYSLNDLLANNYIQIKKRSSKYNLQRFKWLYNLRFWWATKRTEHFMTVHKLEIRSKIIRFLVDGRIATSHKDPQ